jgi:hypothetical protein
MTVSSASLRPAAPFAVGDRVVAARGIGLIRPRVPSGTAGVVAAYSPVGEVEVQFDNGRVELLRPDALLAAVECSASR